MELSAGELVVIPEGVPHSALNPASEDAEMLVFQSPMPKFEFLE
jgi:mannose-6-phosphate isomerase-like protein (cupin superfamily)